MALKPNPPAQITVSKRTECRLCSSKDLVVALPLSPTPLADAYVAKEHLSIPQHEYPLGLYLCNKCGFAQVLDIVHAEGIYVDYIYETVSSLGLVEHFSRYAEEVAESLALPKGSLVVDIGSNDGTLLRPFKAKGMKVLGVDPAREIARQASEAGIPTKAAFFTPEFSKELSEEVGKADVITANNIVANVDDLKSFFTGVKELLSPSGVFIFESFYLSDLIDNMVFDFIYHEHLSAFSVRPLDLFFREQNLELIDVKHIPTKGGSLRYTVQHAGGPRRPSSNVQEFVKAEMQKVVQSLDTFKTFSSRIDRAQENLNQELDRLISQGKTIAGYGASATTTTLLYHFGLQKKISFIADDYTVKQQLYSPGCHIPVFSSAELLSRKPSYVVVFAWRYVDPIARKNQEYIASGGHFIVPLPELRII